MKAGLRLSPSESSGDRADESCPLSNLDLPEFRRGRDTLLLCWPNVEP